MGAGPNSGREGEQEEEAVPARSSAAGRVAGQTADQTADRTADRTADQAAPSRRPSWRVTSTRPRSSTGAVENTTTRQRRSRPRWLYSVICSNRLSGKVRPVSLVSLGLPCWTGITRLLELQSRSGGAHWVAGRQAAVSGRLPGRIRAQSDSVNCWWEKVFRCWGGLLDGRRGIAGRLNRGTTTAQCFPRQAGKQAGRQAI